MWYIIGIGANIGDNIININKAIDILKDKASIIKIASLYSSKALLKEDAPDDWDINYLNTAIKIQTDLSPIKLLQFLKKTEVSIGRNINAPIWSPRIIDLDILAYEMGVFNHSKLIIPHKELLNRSFALLPLLELDDNWKHPVYPNIKTDSLDKIIRLKQRVSKTLRMGICNLSVESFSDGNMSCNARLTNFHKLIDDGAEIIDIGAESTKPTAVAISIDEEFDRLDTFLSYIRKEFTKLYYKPLISIDTRKYEVMVKVLDKYHNIIWMINDVECSDITKKAKLISKYNKKYVITHNTGIINRTKYLEFDTAIDQVCQFFIKKRDVLLDNAVNIDNIYFDIGIGFGKKSSEAKLLLDNITHISQVTKLKSLVGHSRKYSVLNASKNTAIEELDKRTKALTRVLENEFVDIVRVHRI